ncbi:hypothetical protein [Niallia sp. RD1]|uniref:hypothetical protein n=1 Tax=Niallia sp. RD1 TaxID=2962858 RepID=UPI0020C1AAF2|nr:hypothetical protein [Niallia sp. RD1]UTI40429.1 hypothetical protein NKG37_16050 [Niallia sp. RD1]
MKKIRLICIPAFLLFAGCGNDIPDPEVKPKKEANYLIPTNAAVQASLSYTGKDNMDVHHIVKGNKVFVECRVKDYSFREDSNGKLGKVIVEVDGAKKEYSSAAFVIEGLKPGKHTINLSIVDVANETTKYKKAFPIMIKE